MQNMLDKILSALEKILPERLFRCAKMVLNLQFITFLAIGAINTISTTVFAAILDKIYPAGTQTRINFVLGYILGLVLSYFLNSRFTFRKKPTLKSFIKFPVSYIPNFLLQYLCVWILGAVGVLPVFSYLLAAIIALPVTFLIMKFFVY